MKKIFNFTFLLLMALSLVACKSGEKTADSNEEGKSEKQEQSTKMVEDNSDVQSEHEVVIEDENTSSIGTLDIPDSLFISMERTPCLGTCPIYKVSIYESGYAVYEGRNFVEKEGKYYARMNDPELEKIRDEINEIGYFSLKNKYDGPITDIPSTITIVNIDGKQKRVVNRYKGPAELEKFEDMIDEIVDRFEWKSLEEENPEE